MRIAAAWFVVCSSFLVHAGTSARAADAAEPWPRDQDFSWMSIETWKAKHAEDVAVAEAGGVDLLLLGDSITDGWDHHPMWRERFLPLRAANFGIGGDTTQNVLWRLDHGAVGRLAPKAVVLLIGTNNYGRNGDSPADVARGVSAVVRRLESAFPAARILVLGVFPREAAPDAPIRATIRETNSMLAALDDGARVFVRDIGSVFLEPDGSISTAVMPDLLHLSAEGYRRWGLALLPMVMPWLQAAVE
jgi:lysophospholipase L1-like esterase